jgi:glutathione S-transferase
MSEIILHHYAASPFAEKVRVLLGYKRLAWRSVDIPVVMPKPDLLALTGGYRKTPVLQIGCDVYCDTPLIARALDARFPERPIFRAERAATSAAAGRWFDRELFLGAIAMLFHPSVAAASTRALGGPAELSAFAADRARFMTSGPVRPPRRDDGHVLVVDTLEQLDAQLASGGPFLSGEHFGWVDACAYHPLWALRDNTALAGLLHAQPHVLAWLDRIAAFGHGRPSAMSADDALAVCRAAEPAPVPAEAEPLERIKPGDHVEVAPNDYGVEPSIGKLLYATADELAIVRNDERAGRVVVHFPRIGFVLKAHAPG